jgi:hypothetical protein
MITVHIESGICGLETEISACRIQKKSVGIAIKSDCKQVMALESQLRKIDMMDVIKTPINKNPIYEKAGRCNLHSSCPVPCGIIKAAEVELGLALMKDVGISFENDKQVADDAT